MYGLIVVLSIMINDLQYTQYLKQITKIRWN
jgi:hypothetical protein